MDLEKLAAEFSAERKEFEALNTGMSFQDFCKIYPDDFGKIKCRRGFLNVYSSERRGPSFMVEKKIPVNDEMKTDAIDRFKGLFELLDQINLARGNQDKLQQLRKTYSKNKLQEFSQEDRELYLPFIDFQSACKNPWPSGGPSLTMGIDFSFASARTLSNSLKYGSEPYKSAKEYIKFILDDWEVLPSPQDSKEEQVFNAYGEMREGLTLLLEELHSEELALNKIDFQVNISHLDAFLGGSDINLATNKVNCCITGPKGKSRDATILYRNDPAVRVWDIVANEITGNLSPFGIAIFVETEGYHFSAPEKKTRYLVLEGFPANQNYYARIGRLSGKYSEDLNMSDKTITLPQLVYALTLTTAKTQNIPKLFINTEHSGRQRSVEDAVREAAIKANLKQGEIWEFSRHRKFHLLKDPITDSSFAHIDVLDQSFEYTHFLQKPSFPYELMNKLKRDPLWCGEGYFDTWYGWNAFINETYEDWPAKLRLEHPHAHSVYRRGQVHSPGGHPESYWNLGLGYCKGFEVDVKQACKDLGIS